MCDSDGQNQVLLQAQLESNEDVVQVIEYMIESELTQIYTLLQLTHFGTNCGVTSAPYS